MDFGRHSYRPALKREISDNSSIERKSLLSGSIATKKFKSSLNNKDLKKYSLVETQKQVKEKISNLLVKVEVIHSVDELDFKIMEKNLNSVLKTVTLMVSIIFPSFEAKSAQDISDITYKIFQYPYEISNYAFNPCGAPNTWPQIVCLLDWIHDFVYKSSAKLDEDLIVEESHDGESSRLSTDLKVDRLSDPFFSHLHGIPRISSNSNFMSLIVKMRAQKRFEERKGFDAENIPDPQQKLQSQIEETKKKIEEFESKEKSLKLAIQNKIKEKDQKKQRVAEMENQKESIKCNILAAKDSIGTITRAIEFK